ncbi:MAG: AglZ/HisF2 family acetamidino modification protein [Gammaproteobacteria bacterium]|nr:AglZ/HisF2 family acetamidino modification protein [Gammaproteobacteria bacterium]MBU2058450.1 AglZ/HisF2 family acetamidino modification protein [Gammaproteobacteria bacterium]MBU2176497.1 AglZ/HisF2 family acetamidino modification protein [Gammaproteobacteria bacterium]MBU2248561.1 AglZ/HisF2 family acetamidino modification protein [Gammaproteobacteria bacterium]MBU2345576.1 AglZ/HisF2 family acetamidino modification protein [Gammaproteobacteria bacterium]
MLRPRLIPCLLIQDGGLVKTTKFKDAKYVGDPINAVRIFNEKEADELVVLDIDASVHNHEPNYERISFLAAECRMPLCYGGGIKTAQQAKRITALGVEKVAISSAAIENPKLITEMAAEIGSQSVVVVLDVKKKLLSKNYEVWIHNAKVNTKRNPIEVMTEVQSLGAGEIVINFIEHDGTMKGMPIDAIQMFKKVCKVPFTVMGGAGTMDDLGDVVAANGLLGVAAGSLFVFKGPYRAVLINYPNQNLKQEKIYGRCNVQK